jgi:cell division protein ftsL
MKNVIAVLLTLGIPLFLFLGVWQSTRYAKIEKTLQDYDREQYRLIEENKRKISAISILLRNERIEKIATQTFNMRKADSSEILRVEVEKHSSDD